MIEMQDNQLVRRYLRDHDESALELLIARHLPALFAYIRTFNGNADTAADIAQETFVKAWKHLKRYDTAQSFKGWLFTIAKRTAIDELRKKHALPFSALEGSHDDDIASLIPDDAPSVAQQVATIKTGRALTLALDTLPSVSASVVRMHTSDDLSFRQIAEKLRIPLNTVKSHYRRALRVLHQNIGLARSRG